MTKLARNSFGEDYICKYGWDENCFVQCGDLGVVISKKGNYETSFFEAFPKAPDTFIRGEGKNIEEAEENAWKQLQRFKNCNNHEFERRGYTNGVGFCKHCGLFKSKIFEPTTKCKVCDVPTAYTQDINDDWYCEIHKELIPDELLCSYQLQQRIYYRRTHLTTHEDILNLKDIDEAVKEFMLLSFKNEKSLDISNVGKYVYTASKIKAGVYIKRNKYNSFKEIQICENTYYCIILDELDEETKEPTGKFIKMFSPYSNHFKVIIDKVSD